MLHQVDRIITLSTLCVGSSTYIEFSLIHHNSFSKNMVNEFGGSTGYSLVLVHYIGAGK